MGFVPRFVNQTQKCAKALIFPLNGDACHDTNQQIVCYAYTHLRAYGHVEVVVDELFVKFHTDEIPCAGYHVVKVRINLPYRMDCIRSMMASHQWTCIHQCMEVLPPPLSSYKEWIVNVASEKTFLSVAAEFSDFKLMEIA